MLMKKRSLASVRSMSLMAFAGASLALVPVQALDVAEPLRVTLSGAGAEALRPALSQALKPDMELSRGEQDGALHIHVGAVRVTEGDRFNYMHAFACSGEDGRIASEIVATTEKAPKRIARHIAERARQMVKADR
ncbi:hypothetical protein [Yunchengibacter salinarum]|uniref:hypothetical protein n=1 Tax=Yunchengibacter salinarum TaxID=3133399 RepID=UPI0035B59CC2